MSTYHVNFFKCVLNSDGHPFKCLQRRIDVSDAESAAQAAESASRTFEALYGCPWKLHADSIEVAAGNPQLPTVAARVAIEHDVRDDALAGEPRMDLPAQPGQTQRARVHPVIVG